MYNNLQIIKENFWILFVNSPSTTTESLSGSVTYLVGTTRSDENFQNTK